jgi:hypothetical protein
LNILAVELIDFKLKLKLMTSVASARRFISKSMNLQPLLQVEMQNATVNMFWNQFGVNRGGLNEREVGYVVLTGLWRNVRLTGGLVEIERIV